MTTKPQSTTTKLEGSEPTLEPCPHRNVLKGILEDCCKDCDELLPHTRVSANGVPTVDQRLKTYADGYCAQCSELSYPLTKALEKTGVPTGETNWQQTYGPNKVRALADLETCLRRLLYALDEGKPEEIKERITRAKHYIEIHAAIRRRLTALAQQERGYAPAAASIVAPQQSEPDPRCDICGTALVLTLDRRTTWQQYACPESGKGNKLGHTIIPVGYKQSPAPAPSAAVQDETELTKLRQAIGWICDAADAAYIEDSDNARIHEIFNIAAQAAGITRRLPDEYQRFDESGSD